MYPPEILAKMIDYALLRPDATESEVRDAARVARERHFACFCVQPCWVATVAEELRNSDVKTCAVVGFPHGANLPQTKSTEARLAVAQGAQELDMVLNIGALKSRNTALVRDDIEAVASVANVSGLTRDGNEVVIKVIIEMALLTPEEVRLACQLIVQSGADFVKTGTGTIPCEVTPRHIRQIRDVIGTNIGIKVAGGITTLEEALRMIDSGSNRIGSSHAVEILDAAARKPKPATTTKAKPAASPATAAPRPGPGRPAKAATKKG
jgi:deoxyribose-phosphate aldolase